MEHFTPFASLIGGILIGLASAGLLLLNGRIAGISGIAGSLVSTGLRPGLWGAGSEDRTHVRSEVSWRTWFIAGLLVGGAAVHLIDPSLFAVTIDRSALALGAGGLLVGFGARYGSGCTSGHGVCGIGRLSGRSIVATVTFILTGAITVALVQHVIGGSS